MTLYEMLCRSTAQHPDKVCFRFESDEFTYKQTLDAVNRVGHYLLSKGISPGDRVVLVLPNIPAFFFSYFAVTGIGAVAVPINPVWTADEISYILRDADAKALIASVTRSEELACSVPVMIWAAGEQADEWKQILATGCNEPLPGPSGADDLGVFIYTSGTTGKPKGAMLTHKNLTSNVQSTIGALQVKSSDVFICVLPLFHCFAATVSTSWCLCLGAKSCSLSSLCQNRVECDITAQNHRPSRSTFHVCSDGDCIHSQGDIFQRYSLFVGRRSRYLSPFSTGSRRCMAFPSKRATALRSISGSGCQRGEEN